MEIIYKKSYWHKKIKYCVISSVAIYCNTKNKYRAI